MIFTPSILHAADKGCGRDTDLNGSVDLWCPGGDEDLDGYAAGVDCDDHAFFTHPGDWVDAGSGNVKLCQSNGTFAVPVPLSAITCTAAGGTKYFVSPTGSTSAGCGAVGTPCDYRCFQFGNGLGCSVSLSAGSCLVKLAGNYTAFYTESGQKRQYYQLVKNGTPSAKITIMSAPGQQVTLTGPGTSGSSAQPSVTFESSSNIIFRGNDKPIIIVGNFGSQGIFTDGCSNLEFANFIVRDTDGAAGGNISGVTNAGGGNTNNIYHHFFSYGNYMRATPTNENNTQIVAFRGTGWSFKYFAAWGNLGGGVGRIFKLKHADTPMAWEVTGGYMEGASGACVELMGGGGNIHHNVIANCGLGVEWGGGSGSTHFEDNTMFQFNTIVGPKPLEVYTFESDDNSSTFGTLTIQKNVFVKTTGGTNFIDVCASSGDCSDSFYNNVIGGNKVIIQNNLEYNSGLGQVYRVFSGSHAGASGQGATYNSCAAWQAAGFNSGGYCKNPALDVFNRCTDIDCILWGWMPGNASGGGGGDPDPSPTATPTPPPPGPQDPALIGNGRARMLIRGR